MLLIIPASYARLTFETTVIKQSPKVTEKVIEKETES
jgi:hypothetical protein